MSSETDQTSQFDKDFFDTAIDNLPDEYKEFVKCEPVKQVQSYNPLRLELPDPSNYALVSYDKNNQPTKLNRSPFIPYLSRSLVVRVGNLFRKFDGRRYAPLSEEEFDDIIYDASWKCNGAQYMPTESEIRNVKKGCKSLLKTPIMLPSDMPDYEEYFDQPFMPFLNGLLNMDTGIMMPFTQYLPVFHVLRANYDPTIKDAPARQIIEGIIPDPDTRASFFEMLGYIIFEPSLNPPAIFVLYGGAETGKSALANMIEALIGSDSVAHLNMHQLTARFGPADMEGKWLNVCVETGDENAQTTQFNGEMLKAMSGGETITVEQKGKPLYEIKPTAKVLFCTNTQPDFGDDSSGIHRRLLVIPCRQSQDPKAKIHNALKSPESLSWVVNKALEGYRIFKAHGSFTLSQQMVKEKKFFKAQSSLMDFLQTVFETDDKDDLVEKIVNHPEYCYTVNLYTAYVEFTKLALGKPLGKKKFVERIRNEFNLDIKAEGFYYSDGRHSTRNRYIKARY